MGLRAPCKYEAIHAPRGSSALLLIQKLFISKLTGLVWYNSIRNFKSPRAFPILKLLARLLPELCSTQSNYYYLLFKHTNDDVFTIFRTFPKTFQRFPKILQKLSEKRFEYFPTFSEEYRRFPKITDDCRRLPRKIR